jgi:hypothetical protein
MGDILDKAVEGLRVLFRHGLPGVLILIVVGASHPKLLGNAGLINLDQTQHLIVLGAIALVAGNTWYVCHRYTLHQILDYFITAVRTRRTPTAYADWLADHIDKSLRFPDTAKKVHEHIALRSSQIIYLYIVAEVTVAFTIAAETGSFFELHRLALWLLGGFLFIFAFVQQWLLWKVDVHAVKQHGGKP